MNYTCEHCDYNTTDKSHYNRHMKTQKHSIKKQYNKKNAEQDENNGKKYNCDKCNSTFSHNSSLSRHKKDCKGIKLLQPTETPEYKNLVNKVDTLESLLFKYVLNNNQLIKPQTNNSNNNSHNTTYNISVKNYIQKHYPNAPALAGITDYAKLTYNEKGEDNRDDFIDVLVYEYKNGNLHKFLGDFVVEYYKKDDPAEQSVWSSDTSRLTYIIKELLFNKKSIWNHDYKGVKTKNYIINPLLKHIKKYLDEYWIDHLDKFKTTKLDALNELDSIYRNIYSIKKDIDNDILANDISRYMAPHFYMDKKNINGQNMVDYFIDSDEE